MQRANLYLLILTVALAHSAAIGRPSIPLAPNNASNNRSHDFFRPAPPKATLLDGSIMNGWWGADTAKGSKKTTMLFHGLKFVVDSSSTTCETQANGRLICLVRMGQASATLNFEKVNITSNASLGLLRRKRKETWQKEFSSLEPILEEDGKVGIFPVRLQQFKYLHLNNIYSPVLIRAFDVVVNGTTSISVAVICDERFWPILVKELENIMLSFDKAAK